MGPQLIRAGTLVRRWPVRLIAVALMLAAARSGADDTAKNLSYWVGTTKARCGTQVTDHSRCGAVQNITLKLVREDKKLSGSYTCAFGNQNCRGMQATGELLQGTSDGNELSFVTMAPDRSTCRFSGLIEDDSAKGAYRCRGGSQLDERGSWRIQRASGERPPAEPQVPPMLRP